jgi:predicted RNase H-like HicB family nuclease
MEAKEIIFLVEDDLEGGYSAKALGHSIYTQSDTKEELKKNIMDAIACHFDNFEDMPKIVRLHFFHEETFAYA